MEGAPISSGINRRLGVRAQYILLALAAVAALLLFFGVPKLLQAFAAKPPPPAPAPTPGHFTATEQQWATLTFATVQAVGFSDQTQTDGKIATDDDHTTQVFSPFSGRVTSVFAQVGDQVRAGQPLFAVDASEFVQGQSDLSTAAGQIAVAQAAEARQHALYQSGGAAQKDWQQSQAELATAEAALTAARNRLRILGISEADIKAMEHRSPADTVKTAAIVRSPISGAVTQRAIGEGQAVGSITNGGSTPSFVVSDLSKVWLVGDLREVDAPKAKIGDPISVHVLALPNQTFKARVNFVSPTVDPTTRRVTVRAEVENPKGVLKPEMFATISLQTSGSASGIGVPADAVIYEGDTARVWVASAQRQLELRQIQAGQTTDGVVQVLSGLAPGERVVTGGALFIDRAAQGD